MIDLTFALYYALLGIGIGFVAGLVGVGGGGLTVPAFTLLFAAQGIADKDLVHMALGTSMAAMVFTTFSSMRAHRNKGHVNTSLAIKMALGAIVGTFIATAIASLVNGVLLVIFFSFFMLYVAYKMLRPERPKPNLKLRSPVVHLGVGALIGAISALVSVSGAGMSVPYLMSQNLNVKQAIGTSAAIGFPLAIAGTLGYLIHGWEHTTFEHLTFGYIYVPAVVLFSFTSYLSAPFGVACASHLPASKLKQILGVVSLLLSLKMLLFVLQT